ncbi:MAG: ergothioneine biosynthesis protein EgtB [Thermoleophilaceae bacterium]|nr:ergothioneine biosynthesis protein EgtB [Thermoleophilaceae bacterium]
MAPVVDDDRMRVHSRLMSPLDWDLGHIAAFEDLWLNVRMGGLEPIRPDLMEVYDACETPRTYRGELPFLHASEVWDFMDEVRERTLTTLAHAEDPFILEMLTEHEHQHNETMVQTLLLAKPGTITTRPRREWPSVGANQDTMVRIEAGNFPCGDDGEGFAYDNERARHHPFVEDFDIDLTPVTNGAYREWVESGGYRRREWWSPEGWAWLDRTGVGRPLFWTQDGLERQFDRVEPIEEWQPVAHVSWYEAEAFAQAHGKRLPTELEWEKAAGGGDRVYPWGNEYSPGHTNLDTLAWSRGPAGAFAAGASPYGVLGMIGDVWEWTASEFNPWPGFMPYPYREYSEVFFGKGYRVLRGGSWATRPATIRNTFRNWDLPERRQILAGFRCARDA